jgi:DNA-binding NarL/FixJ family response regulator
VIRLIVVEDHPAIGAGLAVLIGATPDIEVLGVAHDEPSADALIDRTAPDIVLCDVMLGGRDAGFDLLARHGTTTRFLLYSAFDYQAHHARAVKGGAAGFVSKMADADTIVRLIHRAAEGRSAFSGDVLESARDAPRPPTDREHELLTLLADGASNDDIAIALGVRVKTVEGMIRRLFDRYGLDNRTQLARYAMRQGWLTADGPRTPDRPKRAAG